ncbi:MAG: hypothetical protein ACKOQ4_11125 [Mycobacterium sp.]
MELSARSYLTAGVAAISVGAIALSPVQPVPNQLALAPGKAVQSVAVDLTAGQIDIITPWVDTLKLAGANIAALLNFYLEQPIPLIKTISANIGTYIQELPDVQLIASQIVGNINTFFKAPWDPGTCATDPCGDPAFYEGDYISNVPITNKIPFIAPKGFSQRELYQLLPTVLQASAPDLLTTLAPLLAFTANHYSGQVAGLVGPLLAPLVVLTRSFTAIGEAFQAGDVAGAVNELLNIPANVTNGVLNGAGYVDLTGVVNAIQPLPPEIKSIGLNLGGLVSPPVPFEGTLEAPTALSGGVLFDNIATEASALGVSVKTPGLPVSWFGSVIGLGQFLGDAMVVTPPAEVTPPARVRARVASATAAAEAAAAAAPAATVKAPATKRPVLTRKAPFGKQSRATARAARSARAAAASHTD